MNILGMGPMELMLIVVLALIVFGPAKLPEIMGQVGKAINDFRRATSELSDEFNRTIQAELQETRAVIDETKSAVAEAHASVNSAVTGLPAPTRTAIPAETVPAPAPNGVSPEPYSETFTNGTVQTQVVSPLADTTQWSWETSAPNAASAETPPGETTQTEPPTVAPVETTEPARPETTAPAPPAHPVPPAAHPTPERAARDELAPPY
ncbi:MAG: twin-arginine translocase TatA/TatE family subunit [Chloroflexi bacterium]|nr:twin-arginine translocase TatA/TatE family subunit [Chloroflexota bacterium]